MDVARRDGVADAEELVGAVRVADQRLRPAGDEGRPQEVATNPEGTYQLFRIGDAVSSRNIHAAIYDALRLCKDV